MLFGSSSSPRGHRAGSGSRTCVVAGCEILRATRAGYCKQHQAASDKPGAGSTWVPDEATNVCTGCKQEVKQGMFGLTSGKHHCRRCGQMFCGKCTSRRKVVKGQEEEGKLRVCDGCFAFDDALADKVKSVDTAFLLAGADFLKHGRGGAPHTRFVALGEEARGANLARLVPVISVPPLP